MAKRMSAKTARNSFSDLLGIVYYSKEAVIVEKRGRPVAAVISMEDYAQLLDAREERLKVFDRLADANHLDGDAQLLLNRDHDATSGGPIQFAEH